MDATLRRYAPLSGAIFAVLYFVSILIGMSDSPEFADTEREIASWYVDSKDEILVGLVIGIVSAPFYVWFLGCLRTAIARVEGGNTRLASTAFGAGVASLALVIAGIVITAMGALRVEEQDAIGLQAAAVYYDIGQVVAFSGAAAAAAATLAATALASLRYRAILPVWLAYLTFVLALLDIIPPISWAGFLIGLLWTLVVSILLFVQRVTDEAAPAATAPPPPAAPPPPPPGAPPPPPTPGSAA
jgi:hypothetical protein